MFILYSSSQLKSILPELFNQSYLNKRKKPKVIENQLQNRNTF